MVVFKMRDSVPSARYSSVCNVLRQWRIWLIPTYRVYRLYDIIIYMEKKIALFIILFQNHSSLYLLWLLQFPSLPVLLMVLLHGPRGRYLCNVILAASIQSIYIINSNRKSECNLKLSICAVYIYMCIIWNTRWTHFETCVEV